MVKISIFLLCYNEELILPYTLKYYKSRFPTAEIVLIDNQSTDNSCKIAEENGCKIRKFESNNTMDEHMLLWIRNHIWKEFVKDSWVIMCDMDEWLDITEMELEEEESKGITILSTQGVNMVGESNKVDLSDINLFEIRKGFLDDNFSKRLCFKYPDIDGIEYWFGAHKCFPQGRVIFSEKPYYLRHYNFLGAEYLLDKHKKRYERNEKSRLKGLNQHYMNEAEKIKSLYEESLGKAILI